MLLIFILCAVLTDIQWICYGYGSLPSFPFSLHFSIVLFIYRIRTHGTRRPRKENRSTSTCQWCIGRIFTAKKKRPGIFNTYNGVIVFYRESSLARRLVQITVQQRFDSSTLFCFIFPLWQ